MLWSQLAPDALEWPPSVRRHYRITSYLQAREGDLTSWRFAKETEIHRLERLGGQEARILGLREAIAEIDQVLRWMRNTDWPFR